MSIIDGMLEQRARDGVTMATDLDTSQMYVDDCQVEKYSAFRMAYSEEVFQFIVDYCCKGGRPTTAQEGRPDLDLCVDVGCGSGQSTTGFGQYFNKVIGVDISEQQIGHAPKDLPNTEFKVASSESLPFLESASVDLWTSAESFNYMPEKETFEEADRVLKPGGTLCIFGYSHIQSKEKIINDAIVQNFIKILPYWPIESKATFEKFKDVKLPYPGWIRNDAIINPQTLTLKQFMGLWGSFYSVVAYQKAHPGENLLADIENSLREAHQKVFGPTEGEDDMVFHITWDIFILIGRKPLE